MDPLLITKVAAGVALMLSVYALVWRKMVEPATYLGFVSGILTALGFMAVGPTLP